MAIHKKEFTLIHLNEEDVGKLYGAYSTLVNAVQDGLKTKPNNKNNKSKKNNNHDSGDKIVSIPHLLSVLKIVSSGNNKFASKLFSSFDKNFTGKINFKEFVFVVWNICTVDTGK